MSKYRKEDNESPELFDIAGGKYYFDLNELSQFIRIEKSETVDDILGEAKKELVENESEEDEILPDPYSQIIDVTKWETTKVMIESVLTEHGQVDEKMGFAKLSDQLSIPFKISFNTLLKYKIIKEEE
jgi:hypothetical protein